MRRVDNYRVATATTPPTDRAQQRYPVFPLNAPLTPCLPLFDGYGDGFGGAYAALTMS